MANRFGSSEPLIQPLIQALARQNPQVIPQLQPRSKFLEQFLAGQNQQQIRTPTEGALRLGANAIAQYADYQRQERNRKTLADALAKKNAMYSGIGDAAMTQAHTAAGGLGGDDAIEADFSGNGAQMDPRRAMSIQMLKSNNPELQQAGISSLMAGYNSDAAAKVQAAIRDQDFKRQQQLAKTRRMFETEKARVEEGNRQIAAAEKRNFEYNETQSKRIAKQRQAEVDHTRKVTAAKLKANNVLKAARIKAGGGMAPTPINKVDLGETLGVPASQTTPWDGLSSKDQGKMRIKINSDASKSFDKQVEALREGKTLAKRLTRFKYLNSQQETGGIMDRLTDTSFDPEKRAMVKIVDAVTPLMRQGLPGAASERDTEMFRGATVGIDVPKEINDNIVTGITSAVQNKEDEIAYKRDYLRVNKHLEGAGSKWSEYLEANPIFNPNKPEGSFELNPLRQTYQSYFSKTSKSSKSLNLLSEAHLAISQGADPAAVKQRLSQNGIEVK